MSNASATEAPCEMWDVNRMFPPWWWTGFVAVGSYEEFVCAADWWDPLWFVQLRQIIWPCLFVVTVIAFFAFSCCIMPRVNGRKDQTGLCSKLGSAVQDRLDQLALIKCIKRTTKLTWNGKLKAVFQHFSGKSRHLDEAAFKAMFSTVGDQFVDPESYLATLHAFGHKIDLNVVETMYSIGCRTWRERDVQVSRDWERVQLITGKITHSDYLVRTGSIGSHGMQDVEDVKNELKAGEKLTKKLKAAKEARERRTSAQARAPHVLLAAMGGAEWGSAVDEEFSHEAAMTEAERATVTLPSLYIETWLFSLICAFLFLFMYDTTRWLSAHVLESPAEATDYVSAVTRFFTLNYLLDYANGFVQGVSDVGHKVCIFHFLFISLFVLPTRVIVTLFPNGCCAKKAQKNAVRKPLQKREFGPPPKGNPALLAKLGVGGSSKVAPAPAGLAESDSLVAVVDEENPQSPKTPRTPRDKAQEQAAGGLVPVNTVIVTGMTLCDKITMMPLYIGRDILGFLVRIAKIFRIDLSLYIIFAPFIDFKQSSLELAHIRVDGVSVSFAADPIDAYMRWLNLKIVNMLSFDILEKYFSGKAEAMYLGYLDAQIRWNTPDSEIPEGIDQTRAFVYFTAGVEDWELFVQNLVYLPTRICLWPSCFGKHRLTAQHQLTLSKYRFGGRQPRLGGVFVGKGGCNMKGFTRVCKLNVGTLCCDERIGCFEGKYEKALDANIEWVVPPSGDGVAGSAPEYCVAKLKGKKLKCCRPTYWLMPFPFDKPDEDDLSIDTAIPIIIEDSSAFSFWFPDDCDYDAMTDEDVATTMVKWVKASLVGRKRRAEVLARSCNGASTITAESVRPLVDKYTGGSKDTFTIHELADAIHALELLASDVRVSSPVFKRVRSTSHGSLMDLHEHKIVKHKSHGKNSVLPVVVPAPAPAPAVVSAETSAAQGSLAATDGLAAPAGEEAAIGTTSTTTPK